LQPNRCRAFLIFIVMQADSAIEKPSACLVN